MPNTEKHSYEFGPFRIDTVERLLFRSDQMIPLTPKVIDTLLVLLAYPSRLMDKDEILNLVYPDTIVEENAVAKNISALRKVLGDGYIQTISKRGYRFVAKVNELQTNGQGVKEDPAPPPPDPNRDRPNPLIKVVLSVMVLILVGLWWFIPPGVVPGPRAIHSLAVLPLDNLSQDQAQEYFTEGMHEELINTLAKVEALRVISRTSAMTYKGAHKRLPQIAQELNVDAIVEGSVRQSDNRVRIAVELFEGKTEKQLWAQSYEKDLRDVLGLQAEIAGAIAHEIQVKVTPQERQRIAQSRRVDPDAYLAYTYGRFYWNKRTPDDFPRAINYFRRAIAKDPTFSPAYAGLADALALLGSIGSGAVPPKQAMPQAKAAAMQAVSLDDNLAEGHTSLANIKQSYDWDLDGAEREFKRALELNPGYATAHHWYAHYFLARNQPERAVAEIRRAQALDPLSFIINVGVGWCLYHARRYDDAIQEYHKALDLNPDFPLTHCTLGMALLQKKAYEDALSEFNKAKILPGSPTFAMANIAGTYALAGRAVEARRLLAELQQSSSHQYVPAIYIAAIYTALGDKNEAFNWLQRGYNERDDYMIYLKTEPWGEPLHSDPRFQRLLDRIASGK